MQAEEYLARRCARFGRLRGPLPRVELSCPDAPVELPDRTCRALGLVATVLAVRACRYAFPATAPGTVPSMGPGIVGPGIVLGSVQVRLEVMEEGWRLLVADDGCGMPLTRIADARGARIVEAVAARIGGRVAWTVSGEGTAVSVRFGRAAPGSHEAAAPARPHPAAGTARKGGVVVITGASSGIGRCAAGLFARHGWRVGLVARGEAGLHAARGDVEAHGAPAAAEAVDVADMDALEAAAARIEQRLGPIDVWVNCAGNGTYGRFLDTPADQFRRVTDVTYLGTVNGTRAALQRMMPRDRGRIVNVCSGVAFHGMPLLSSYSGAKHAVRGFDQSLRAELAQEGSRVRLATIFPPAVNTPFFEHAPTHMGRPARPIPPVYQPEVVAEAILLAATTGQGEMPVSFTAALFALGVRVAPVLMGRAIRRLGYDGQLVDRDAPPPRHAPTLFAPSDRASPVRGCFPARGSSLHLGLLRLLARKA